MSRKKRRGSIWVVGDLHGCLETFLELLDEVGLDQKRDRLWLVGDLVNRGPNSLEVLRLLVDLQEEMGKRLVAVLGNHDLHLLAVAAGAARARRDDTLEKFFKAPDRKLLLSWLSARPLLYAKKSRAEVLVHAGILPGWSVKKARKRARRLEDLLRRPRDDRERRALLQRNGKDPWRNAHRDLGAFTRLRMCRADGSPASSYRGPPQGAPRGLTSWWKHPLHDESWLEKRIFFGHWAALGCRVRKRVVCLDGGVVWGRNLCALRLEDDLLIEVPHAD